jgi:hypothetical protein
MLLFDYAAFGFLALSIAYFAVGVTKGWFAL